MSLTTGMFVFEVVLGKIELTGEGASRNLMIKSDFADIFSLELKDPKKMHIVMPEPLPPPPEPVGKKGKKKKKPKPKKKGKKKKGAAEDLPPPEPDILAGQSVLFASSAEVIIQNMKKYNLEISVWSKDDNLVLIGSCNIAWDPVFPLYLEKLIKCENPPPPVVKDDYNVFQEGSPKIMATVTLQVKLSYLTDRLVSSFRTLSEDPTVKKVLYTGLNSKTTSYMCTLKTTDEEFAENCKRYYDKLTYVKVRPPLSDKPIAYASYKNAPSAKLPMPGDFDENYCCKDYADKPPDKKYKAPETCPDVDFIADYVRKIISSCNDNMRMLTPRPTIRPRVKATDIDKLCYCRETSWPQGALAERFRRATQGGPCPVCVRETGKDTKGVPADHRKIFDLACLRGPCGRPDCRIARDMRAYIEKLLDEDNKEFNISDVIGPCGSKSCTLVDRIKEFLRHEGVFAHGSTLPAMSTQCACMNKMKEAFDRVESCASICSIECDDEATEPCGGISCPFSRSQQKSSNPSTTTGAPPPNPSPTPNSAITPKDSKKGSDKGGGQGGKVTVQHVHQVYYFTVEYDDPPSNKTTPKSMSARSSKYKFCPEDCPMLDEDECVTCSKNLCLSTATHGVRHTKSETIKCLNPACPHDIKQPSPADSEIEINFDDIRNPCCVKSCEVAENVKDFIVEALEKKNTPKVCTGDHDPCYCDCDCSFKLTAKTTYCGICGGYECLGDDVRNLPDFRKPHPCPIYHKLYNRKTLRTESPFPEDEPAQSEDTKSGKGKYRAKSASHREGPEKSDKVQGTQETPMSAKEERKKSKSKPGSKRASISPTRRASTKSGGRASIKGAPKTGDKTKGADKKEEIPYRRYPLVPYSMGWLWNAKDIPGLEYRPSWKPGATHKALVRKYRTVREGVDNIAKKKRAMMQRKKKQEFKPHLVIEKHNGEYKVSMEVFKKFSKERLRHQYPYDETPPVVYTVGKNDEMKAKMQKKKERRERRENRRKSRLLQATFRDKCQEICLKAYNQAMGILPLPNPNSPDCPCDVPVVKYPDSPIIDSCSCSDEGSFSSSDTDDDEWIIEFTPPIARWDPKAKHYPTYTDNECQYNYLDFRVRLLDKQGNQVPRFFKGPDGKEQCSDLGGFWDHNHRWLEINKDGYIGPDERWVPHNYIGPDGQHYTSEEGGFTDIAGTFYKIGIDGYIDKDNKWVWYDRRRTAAPSMATEDTKKSKGTKKKRSDASFKKCYCKKCGQGHGEGDVEKSDKKEKDKTGKTSKARSSKEVPNPKDQKKDKKGTKAVSEATPQQMVMNVAVDYDSVYRPLGAKETLKLKSTRLSKYREIMTGEMYDKLEELRMTPRANRACNTANVFLIHTRHTDKTSSNLSRSRNSVASPFTNYTNL